METGSSRPGGARVAGGTSPLQGPLLTGVQGRPPCAGGCGGGWAGLTPLEGLTPRPGLQGQWARDRVGSSFPASALSAQASDLSSQAGSGRSEPGSPLSAVTGEDALSGGSERRVGGGGRVAGLSAGPLGTAASAGPGHVSGAQPGCTLALASKPHFLPRPQWPRSALLALSFCAGASGQQPRTGTSGL